MILSGKVPLSVLDDKIKRILTVQHKIGMYNEDRLSGSRNTLAHQLAARKIAENGIVLLKNKNSLLPIKSSKIKNILVMGPNADKVHALGGGSSEVKTSYEITPLQGLKNAFGENVEFTVLRAKSSALSPIASDYIKTRHWTGTPSWKISHYLDQQKSKIISEDWHVDAQYKVDKGASEYFTMSADVKTKASGMHSLELEAVGIVNISVNNKVVLSHQSKVLKKSIVQLELKAEQVYQFSIDYQGTGEFILGWQTPGNLFVAEQAYLAVAKSADAVIYFGGLSHADDREAIDRVDMRLPNKQDETIEKLLSVNSNTVVFLIAGSAVEMPWVAQANTIVWGWYGGMEAGNAFANMLTGKVNPSGKMPITLPVRLSDTAPIVLNDYNEKESFYSEGVFIGYRWFEQQDIKPLFPFGHGLSYSRFHYSDITLSNENMAGDQTLIVTANIKNISNVAGAEVAQLYITDEKSRVERPIKELKGFDKIWLAAGETKSIKIKLTKRDLSFWDSTINDWFAEPGKFTISLGSSLTDIRLQKSFVYRGGKNKGYLTKAN